MTLPVTDGDDEWKQKAHRAQASDIMRNGFAGRKGNELQEAWVQDIMETNCKTSTVVDVFSHQDTHFFLRQDSPQC